MNINKALALLLLLGITLAAGCAQKTISSTPAKPRVTAVSKQIPARDRIPPTQKPYKIEGKSYYPIPSAYGYSETGTASWYGDKFHGRKTSNGETYDMHGPTAAHKILPMNTRLLVQNLENGKETIVRVNDRGPFVKGRIIDLSFTAAKQIDMAVKGTAKVRVTALGEATTASSAGGKIERFLPYQDFDEGEFYVQVGAFTEKSNADRLKVDLLHQGRKAVSQTYHLNGTTFYRVQVRTGTHLHEAKEVEHALEARYPGAFVIAR